MSGEEVGGRMRRWNVGEMALVGVLQCLLLICDTVMRRNKMSANSMQSAL